MPDMAKTPKRPRDPNQLAKLVVDIATGTSQDDAQKSREDQSMSSLGRIGGLKGGRARAEKLTPEERSDIARAAALARWTRTGSDSD